MVEMSITKAFFQNCECGSADLWKDKSALSNVGFLLPWATDHGKSSPVKRMR